MWSSPCHHYHSLCWGDLGENTQRSPYSLSLTQCRAESEIFKLLVLGLESSLTYFFAVFISSVVLYSGLYGTNLVQKLHWDPQEKVSDWVKKISREQKPATLFAVTNASGHLLWLCAHTWDRRGQVSSTSWASTQLLAKVLFWAKQLQLQALF